MGRGSRFTVAVVALVLTGCGILGSDDTADEPEAETPADDQADEPEADGGSDDGIEVEIEELSPEEFGARTDEACAVGAEPDPSGWLDPSAFLLLPALDGPALCVGPSYLSGDVVESAEFGPADLGAGAGTTDGQIALVLTESGVEGFNRLAARCLVADPVVCPQSRLAIVVDGTVLTAPVLMDDSFERDQIVITGRFTDPSRAQELAALLEDDQIQFRAVVTPSLG
jgi:hypothetical protein